MNANAELCQTSRVRQTSGNAYSADDEITEQLLKIAGPVQVLSFIEGRKSNIEAMVVMHANFKERIGPERE